MTACRCGEHKREVHGNLPDGSNQRPRQWFVLRRNESCSAFNGYRREWSDFSDVMCRVCRAHWRTKASYVGYLQNCEYWPKTVAPTVDPIDAGVP